VETADIAAAALQPDHKGKCLCRKHTKDGKPQKACPKCHGSGVVTACSLCEGSGWNSKLQNKCERCGGLGFL
jgi:DnaJ-class molecular chaperone